MSFVRVLKDDLYIYLGKSGEEDGREGESLERQMEKEKGSQKL